MRIAWLPGDGVGFEVTQGPVQLLRSPLLADLVEVTGPWPVGATGFHQTGELRPPETFEACREADAILLGAVGEDPAVDKAACPRPELSLVGLRREFDLRVSVREVLSPSDGQVTTVVRNLLGGAYTGEEDHEESDGVSTEAADRIVLTPPQVAEVAEIAFDLTGTAPSRRVISVDKWSLYATSRLWRDVVTRVADERGVGIDHVLVDRAAYELASTRPLPQMVITEGLFGDILSDLICGRAGSPALCGSASIRPSGGSGVSALYEPAHGSAPARTGHDVANPTGSFLALAMLLDTDDATKHVADAVRRALLEEIATGEVTYDLAADGTQPVGTREFAERVVATTERLASVAS